MELKIDIDHARNYLKVKSVIDWKLRWIDYYFDIMPLKIKVYKTRKGFHWIISNPDVMITEMQTIVVQACLGSDWLREIRNMKRIKDGMTKYWNIMFTCKFDDTGKIISKEKFVSNYELV